MKRNLILLFAMLLCASPAIYAQRKSLKEQAVAAFKAEQYDKAIELLKKAEKATPKDPEVYYLLGFYTHYNAYDSRPLEGYNKQYSDKVFQYLEKALELKPDYGDAKYFYGAECSANAFRYMQHYEADSLRLIYKKAYDKGAYPAWLLEYGRNLLTSCEQHAIFFAGGNPDFDVCMYLQLHENLRKDITVIPIGNIDRPWYVSFLKKGLHSAVREVKIGLTEEQVEDIHPYKWDTTTVTIPISAPLKKQLKLSKKAAMEWTVEPDLVTTRMKQENRVEKRTFLSPQRAVLLHIVETNAWERPVYFSNGAVTELLGGLNEYTQDCGLVSKLLPVKTKDTKHDRNVVQLKKLIENPANFKDYKTIVDNDIPRISAMTSFYLRSAFLLAQEYSRTKNKKGLEEIKKIYENTLRTGVYKAWEEYYWEDIKVMK